MLNLFKKKSPEEKRKVQLFSSLMQEIPNIHRFSYRNNGKFEIIFEGVQIGKMTDPENQAVFNLLSHVWLIIWGNDQAELHVGVTNQMGFRLEIDASKLYIGHKFQDHEEQIDELLSKIGLNRKNGYVLA